MAIRFKQEMSNINLLSIGPRPPSSPLRSYATITVVNIVTLNKTLINICMLVLQFILQL